jgi:hypothetical protein
MCSTDFEFHIEEDAFGCEIYPSEKACREQCSCVDPSHEGHCGIVRVEITIIEVVQESENG